MTKGEIETIRNIVERIRSERMGAAEGILSCTDKQNGRIYINSWIIGPLELLLPENRNVELARRLSRK